MKNIVQEELERIMDTALNPDAPATQIRIKILTAMKKIAREMIIKKGYTDCRELQKSRYKELFGEEI